MNLSPYDPKSENGGQGSEKHPVDATLRVLANLSVPEGIEDRIHAKLRTAPRKGNLLSWPISIHTGWVRSAAAAVIVLAVGGGGWGVYSHIERPQQPGKVVAVPANGSTGGGFSSAGAMRTPQSLNRPVIKHTAKGHPGKLAKKPDAGLPADMNVQPGTADKSAIQMDPPTTE